MEPRRLGSLVSMFRRQSGAPEQRVVTSSAAIPKNSEQYGVFSGVQVTDQSAMTQVAVQASIRVIADSISILPLDAYRKQGGQRALLDPQPTLIREPFGGELINFEGFDQIGRCLAARGESLSWNAEFDGMERVTRLEPVHPDDWSVRRDKHDGEIKYSLYGEPVPRWMVTHMKRFSMPNELHAISPVAKAANAIGVAIAAERYGATWFRDSANPSAVLEAAEDLTEDQVALSQQSWIESHGGKRRPAVLSGGLKYRNISITPNESQFLETRKYSRSEIASLFGVPPHMIGDTERSTSWGSGIEQQSIGYVRFTLMPYLQVIEQHLSRHLPRGQFVKFNVDALLRAETLTRFMAYVHARNAGWMNVNEIRSLEDLPPVPGGDTYIQPLNMGPLGSDPLAAKEDGNDPVTDPKE